MLSANANSTTDPSRRGRRGTNSDTTVRCQSSGVMLPLDQRAARTRHHDGVGPKPAATEASIRRFADLVATTVVAGFRNQLTDLPLGDEPRLPFSIESLLDGRLFDPGVEDHRGMGDDAWR